MGNNKQTQEEVKFFNKCVIDATKYSYEEVLKNYKKYKFYKYPKNIYEQEETRMSNYWANLLVIHNFHKEKIN